MSYSKYIWFDHEVSIHFHYETEDPHFYRLVRFSCVGSRKTRCLNVTSVTSRKIPCLESVCDQTSEHDRVLEIEVDTHFFSYRCGKETSPRADFLTQVCSNVACR